MHLDPNHCYAALKAQDARFDGQFFVGVVTTGIYCRPVCTARTPRAASCRYFAQAASAEAAGFRPCLRCRPELAPGRAPTDAARRVAEQAVARIEGGALSEGSLDALAAEFGLSSRQLRRVIEQEYGVSPVALAQTRRLLLAKQLLTDSRLGMAEIAFASGFSSVRRFNHLFRSRYGLNPTALRRRAARAPRVEPAAVTLKLGYRPPLAWPALVAFLGSRGAASQERVEGQRFLRTVRIGEQCGWISARPVARSAVIEVAVAPSLVAVLTPLRARLRRLFDLDANPAVIAERLSSDARLADLVQQTPGLRVPGALDGFELALRAILGQQISVKAASTVFGRFLTTFGEPLVTPFAGLDRLAPRPESLADADLQQIIDRGLTRRRAETIRALARAVADGGLRLDPQADPAATRVALAALPGIGPWTTQYILMRALGLPDALPDGDLGLLRALQIERPRDLAAAAQSWRPWRAYAAMYLWHSLGSGG